MPDNGRRTLILWAMIGGFFIALGGRQWHFFYEWFPSLPMAMVALVNESVWEHNKLFYGPALIYAAITFPFVKKSARNYLLAITASIYTMIVISMMAFGIYQTVSGVESIVFTFAVFISAIVIAQWMAYKIMRASEFSVNVQRIGSIALIALGVALVLFTFIPPQIPLFFMDPVTGKYGMS